MRLVVWYITERLHTRSDIADTRKMEAERENMGAAFDNLDVMPYHPGRRLASWDSQPL